MTNDIYMVGDETTVHVYEGMKCMGIYDKKTGAPKFTTGFDRLDNELDGADRDGDLMEVPEFLVKRPKDYSHKPNDNEARFRQITKEMLELYSRKNTDYGGSFDESLDDDGLLVAKIRLKDKLNRFSQLIDNDILVASESIEDTLIDLANYSIMTLMWINDEKD